MILQGELPTKLLKFTNPLLLLGRPFCLQRLKCRFSPLLIVFSPARKHTLCQAIFSTNLSRTLLSCGYLAHDLQFKLTTMDSFLHLSSPCVFLVYTISEKLTSFALRSNRLSPG